MPFGVVSGVGRGMGELDGVVIVEGEEAGWGKCRASHYQLDSLLEGRRRGSSQISSGFLVKLKRTTFV